MYANLYDMEVPRSIKEAREIQRGLKQKIRIIPLDRRPEFIAGVDAAFTGSRVIAAACLYKFPELVPVEDAYAATNIPFPYVPGFLSFREGPAIIRAINKLRTRPDLVLFDGQGIAHPARMGIAAHVGVLLGIPSVGCAKSRLTGSFSDPGNKKGSSSVLTHHNEIIGKVLRTRDNVRPLFVSPGHLIDLKTSVDIVLACTGKFRIPEPLRRADSLSKTIKMGKRP